MKIQSFKKNLILFIIIHIFAINSLFCQSIETENNNSCLWKIQSKSNTVYLLGSIHFLKENEYPLNSKIESVFSKINNVVFEVNIDCTKNQDFQNYTLSKAKYNGEQTLSSELSKKTYKILEEKMNTLGMNISSFNGYKPWFISVTLTLRKIILLGFNPNVGIDKYFFDKAKNEGKKIHALESPKFQIDLLSDLGKETDEELLLQTIEEYDSISFALEKILSSWRQGDLSGLNTTLNKSLSKYPELKHKLLVERNLNWIEKITEYLEDNKQYLVIVGAGHLPGEKGLINILSGKGYIITQL